MSAIKLIYLYCDGGAQCPREDGNSEQPYIVDPIPGQTAAMQREAAKQYGWVRKNGKDYCSACASRYVGESSDG